MGLRRNAGRAFSSSSKSSSVNADSVLLAVMKQIAKTPKRAGTRNKGDRWKLNVRKLSARISGTADIRVRISAFDNPFVIGTCATLRSDNQARSVVASARSALPMAPAVVPRAVAPRPTAAKSIRTAAKLISRTGFVLPTAWSVVMRSRLCAEKMIVAESIANGMV